MGDSTVGRWRHLVERTHSIRRALLRLEILEDRNLLSASPLAAATDIVPDVVTIPDEAVCAKPALEMIYEECPLDLDWATDDGFGVETGEEMTLEIEVADDEGVYEGDGYEETVFWDNPDDSTDPNLFDKGGDEPVPDILYYCFMNPEDVRRTLVADDGSSSDMDEMLTLELGASDDGEVFMAEETGPAVELPAHGTGTIDDLLTCTIFTLGGAPVDNFEVPPAAQDVDGSSLGDPLFYTMTLPGVSPNVTTLVAPQESLTTSASDSSFLAIALKGVDEAAPVPETPKAPLTRLAQPAASTEVEADHQTSEKAEAQPAHTGDDLETEDLADSLFSSVDEPF